MYVCDITACCMDTELYKRTEYNTRKFNVYYALDTTLVSYHIFNSNC